MRASQVSSPRTAAASAVRASSRLYAVKNPSSPRLIPSTGIPAVAAQRLARSSVPSPPSAMIRSTSRSASAATPSAPSTFSTSDGTATVTPCSRKYSTASSRVVRACPSSRG